MASNSVFPMLFKAQPKKSPLLTIELLNPISSSSLIVLSASESINSKQVILLILLYLLLANDLIKTPSPQLGSKIFSGEPFNIHLVI
ncbi:hypothetical protein ACEQ103284_09420 [Actinobacillus equuli subsp. equuli]